jgi:hypothetical protein
VIVQLTPSEMVIAATVGSQRRISAILNGRRPNYGSPTANNWGIDIEAAGAELAVAKVFGLWWNALVKNPVLKYPDVGNLQVRHTLRTEGRLIVHATEPDDDVFVLVRGCMPRYLVVGWIKGSDAKHADFWFEGDGRAAFFVWDSRLGSLTTAPFKALTALDDYQKIQQSAGQ